MTGMKKTLALALGALMACTLAFAQAAPPTTGSDAERKQEAVKRAQEAERRAKEAEKQAQAAEEKAREMEHKIQVMQSRPRLGVLVNTDADAKTDPVGALLTGVTPGGPAEEAGVKAGDIVVKFNGQPLVGANPQADEGESAPGMKLLQFAKNLKPGEKVTLEVKRGKELKSYTFEPRPLGAQTWVFKDFEVPNVHVTIPKIEIPDMPELLMHYGGGFDMELVALNPELGEYFGTSEGLLVVRAPKGEALKLKGGDVLVKIGDRVPKTPSQAFRILHSYEPGEQVNFEVIRKQKHQKLTVKMPERVDEFEWEEAPEPPEPPQERSFQFFSGDEAPPAPPAQPAPPVPPGASAGRA